MGRVSTVIHAFKQNITGGAFEALAAGTGDALTLPNFTPGSNAYLEEMVGSNSANACDFDVRSPRLHDNTRGIRVAHQINPTVAGTGKAEQLLMAAYATQNLYSGDTLTAEVNGTATNNVGLDLYVYYEDLPGGQARLANWEEISPRIRNIVGIKVAVVAGAAGDYGATRALNADDDRLKSDTDYALLGVDVQAPCLLLTIKGPDTSNFRVPMPGFWNSRMAASWFIDQSKNYGRPHIPVFNANNKGATLLEAADPGGAVAAAPTLMFAELG